MSAASEIFKTLTDRESEVAGILIKGSSNKEIATKLGITEKTVKFHITNIYKKFGQPSRMKLISWVFQNNSKKLDFET